MSEGVIAVIVTQAVTLVLGVVTAWVTWLTRRQARRAADLSEPTGNGFAGAVLSRLDTIDARAGRTEAAVERLHGRMAAHEADCP